MRVLAAAMLLAVGCADEHNPWIGGGGGGGGAGGVNDTDASTDVDGGGGSGAVNGRICVGADLRYPDACGVAFPGAQVLSIELNELATADAGGYFAFDSVGDSMTLTTSPDPAAYRPTIVLVQLPATDLVGVQVVPLEEWATLVSTLGVNDPLGDAAIAIHVRNNGVPVPGAQVSAPTGAAYPAFYDDGGPFEWTEIGGTGDAGAALLLGVPERDGEASFSVDAGGGLTADVTVPIAGDATTFAVIEL